MRRPVVQRQRAAVGQHDRVGDGKAEAEARGFIHVAGAVAAHEGCSIISFRASEMPGPSSSISMVVPSADSVRPMVVALPKRAAFSTRLVMQRCRSSGLTIAIA
jgi:hypothetical protein